MTQTATATGPNAGNQVTDKFLTLFLGEEEYGIQILRVREIIGMMPITWVPRAPSHVRGVINLRGRVIPIVDMRLKFDMPEIEATEETCIIVVQSGQEMIGTVVDKVSEVVDIARDDIVDPPALGTDVDTQYILGIGKAQGGVKLLLDIDKVLSDDAVKALAAADEATTEAPAAEA